MFPLFFHPLCFLSPQYSSIQYSDSPMLSVLVEFLINSRCLYLIGCYSLWLQYKESVSDCEFDAFSNEIIHSVQEFNLTLL